MSAKKSPSQAGRIFYVLTCIGAALYFSVKAYVNFRSGAWVELSFSAIIAVMAALALILYKPKVNKNDVSWFGSGGGGDFG